MTKFHKMASRGQKGKAPGSRPRPGATPHINTQLRAHYGTSIATVKNAKGNY